MLLLLLVYALTGVLFVILSVPLIQGWVGPNRWYGFRVRRTLEDPEVWDAANRYMAWRLLWLGAALTVAAVALYFVPGMNAELYALLCTAVLLVGMFLVVVQSFRFLRTWR